MLSRGWEALSLILGDAIRQLRGLISRLRGESLLVRHLSYPLMLEQAGPPILVRIQIVFYVVTVAEFLAWASVTPLKETVRASGEVIPSGSVIEIQHLEGGIVSDIFVRDGELVERGDALVRLDSSAALSQQMEIDARAAILEIRSERLRAFVENRRPNYRRVPKKFSKIVQTEMAIFKQQEEEIENELTILKHQKKQRMAELETLRSQSNKLIGRARILFQQLNMREALLAKGLVSRVLYYQTLVQHGTAVGELQEVKSKIVRARSAIGEADSKIKQARSSHLNKALDELGSVTAEWASVNETAVALRDRVTRLEIRAPVRGIVKGLIPNALGGVIQPGGMISEIVPVDEELVVEARINPSDIGHIRRGQEVEVKITTYDFSRFGSIDGRVVNISGTTFKDKEGEVYYKAEITLEKNYVGNNKSKYPILPGMISDISIGTGERTLLKYLFKPIYLSLDSAFSER